MAHDATPLHLPMLGSSPAGQPQGTPTCRAGTCRVFSDHGFLSEITSFWVFRTYLQGIEKTKMFAVTFAKAIVTGSTAAALEQRANVHTALLSKCTHILQL